MIQNVHDFKTGSAKKFGETRNPVQNMTLGNGCVFGR
jgi:hypothetical protein